MTKNEILSRFFKSKDFRLSIVKLGPRHLLNDLRSEVALVLCEEEDWFIEDMYYRDELKYWAVRIIQNMVKSKTSAFRKKYRMANAPFPPMEPTTDDGELSLRNERENVEDHALALIEDLHWYKRELLQLYAKHASFRKISRITGIPYQSVRHDILRACAELKQKAYEQD